MCTYRNVCVQLTGAYVQLAFWFTVGASVRYVIHKMLRGATAQSKLSYKVLHYLNTKAHINRAMKQV